MGQTYEHCSCMKSQKEDTIKDNNSIETNVHHDNIKNKRLKYFNGIFNKILKKIKKEVLIQSTFRGFYFRKIKYPLIKEQLIKEEKYIIDYYKYRFIPDRIKELNSNFYDDFSVENYKKYFPSETIPISNYKIPKEYILKAKCLIKKINKKRYLYIGEVNYKNEFNGYGELYTESNEKFEGIFTKNKLNGWGRYIEKKGNCYEGNFINTILNGKGICIRNTKDNEHYSFYIGDFINFKKEGFGKEETEEYLYEGNFKNNKKNGKGKIEYKKIDDIYIGEFLNDEITGFGYYKWANKHTYEGDFINGKMDGKGIYKWPEGGEYNGDYVNNIKEGYGVFKWADGKIFIGPFGNGKPNGKGKLTIENVTINCEFNNGKFKGNLKEILKFKKMEIKENEKEESINSI